MSKKYNYRKLKPKEYNSIKRIIDDVYDTAAFYDAVFINKRITFYTSHTSVALIASATNFMHLCGIYYLRGSKNFFIDAIDRKIDLSKVLIKKDGTTFQKLQVLSSFPELISKNVRLTKRGKYLLLDYDYALRTSRQILALTLLNHRKHFYVVPQSILNLHKIKKINSGEPVIKIVSEDFKHNKSKVLFAL